jgi:hypothetical protein
MATERQKTIVKKHKKNNESRGINRGYVVQGDDGVVRNARMDAYQRKPCFQGDDGVVRNARMDAYQRKPCFIINDNGKKYRISTGCSKLEMGSSHTCTHSTGPRTFMVLREL